MIPLSFTMDAKLPQKKNLPLDREPAPRHPGTYVDN
jgi:hypothetical protein